MAKYTFTMSCGHEETVELLGKTRDRDRKIEYLKEHGLCRECFIKNKREQEQSEPFTFNAWLLPYIDQEDGSILFNVWFSGNTFPHKDKIKALKYTWSVLDIPTATDKAKYWNKIVKEKDLQAEIQKANKVGIEKTNFENLKLSGTYQLVKYLQQEWKNKQQKINQISKPRVPEKLKGCRWNNKIYGKPGNYSIYPDGKKVSISDEEAKEIEAYCKAKANYNKQVEEIKYTEN